MICQDKSNLGCVSQPASFKLIMFRQPPKLQENFCLHQAVGSLTMDTTIIFSFGPISLPSQVLLSYQKFNLKPAGHHKCSPQPTICASGAFCCTPYNDFI